MFFFLFVFSSSSVSSVTSTFWPGGWNDTRFYFLNKIKFWFSDMATLETFQVRSMKYFPLVIYIRLVAPAQNCQANVSWLINYIESNAARIQAKLVMWTDRDLPCVSIRRCIAYQSKHAGCSIIHTSLNRERWMCLESSVTFQSAAFILNQHGTGFSMCE